MSDLIRREDVLTVLCFCEETKMMLCKDLRKILEKIDAIPSAEPERTAKVTDTWKISGFKELNAWCPECEHRITRGCSYCPTCGVKLEWK